VYRWDLDKTYLETDFDSLRGLVRTATESASTKKATPGATALMRGLCADPAARVAIVSGSPVQMRAVLEQKLKLDGVRYESLVLKDSLRHLKKGELRAIRGQMGYKLPALLEGRVGLGRGVGETCFGDDAEVDAIVYSVYADALAGRLRPADVARILEAAGAYPPHVEATLSALARVATADPVERIFIRVERGRSPATFAPLGGRVVPVYSWFQAALVLHQGGRLDEEGLRAVLLAVMEGEHVDAWTVGAWVQDIVRRGFLAPAAFPDLGLDPTLRLAIGRALERVSDAPAPAAVQPFIDYIRILQAWHQPVEAPTP
jgi:hypothetical protein